MNNLNECTCITVNRLRQHHGVVCTTCNPNKIETLLIPNAITAYRIWRFDIQNGFKSSPHRNRGWSEFNDVLPPGFKDELDQMKPWSGKSFCLHNDHKAPNPYCSCGYYSVNTFGKQSHRPFGHDATEHIVRDFERMLPIMERYDKQTQQIICELLFYSPVAKTIEIENFSLLSEVELTGTIIECELGYRSEFVTPKKMFLLLDFDRLCQIMSFLGEKLEKDRREILHFTYKWVVYINDYLTNMMKLYGLDFELRFKYRENHLDNFEMTTGNQIKGSNYIPFNDHPLVYRSLLSVSERRRNAYRFASYQYPALDFMLEKLIGDTTNIAYFDRNRNSLGARYRRNKWVGTPVKLGKHMRREHIADVFQNYADYLIAFSHFDCMLRRQKNDITNLLSYPNLDQQFGFRYHTYLENKYTATQVLDKYFISKEHPSFWFKNIYPYFEQHLEKIGRNSMPKYQQVNFDER